MGEFQRVWNSIYQAELPVAHLMRKRQAEKWVRIHSLPDSKRYSENEQEKRIILDRANKLATRVLGEGAECWLIQALVSVDDEIAGPESHAKYGDFIWTYEFERFSSEDECRYVIYSTLVEWSKGAFDVLISDIADFSTINWAWVAVETGSVFAPYDGGADVFLQSSYAASELKPEFSDWLSDCPDGL